MTDSDKLALSKRTMAQIADQCTDAIMDQGRLNENGYEPTNTECLRLANEALVLIREQAQDALGELMQQDEPAPKSLGTYHGPDSP